MEEKKQGGKRVGAGRKPLPIMQKKEALTIFPSKGDFVKFGDKKKMAATLMEFIANYKSEPEKVTVQPITAVSEASNFKPVEDAPLSFEALNQQVQPVQSGLKTFEQWQSEKRACETEEEWTKIRDGIKTAPNLTRKQKDLLIKYS